MVMAVRGLRGAINARENTSASILEATRELLQEVIRANSLTDFSEIVSAIFTTSPDLNAAYPAEAARELGMHKVPLLCAREIDVPGGVPLCIRILLHLNTEKRQEEIVHVYLRDARKLRPDMNSAQ
jgi:chorismate mutase